MWIVTGASGFVGGQIIAELGSNARGIGRREVPVWDSATLRPLLRGAEGVIHAASVVHRPDMPIAEYERFNVEGTRALVDAARAEGVRRFVFVSSIKVHGETPAGVIDERTPVLPDAPYASTKAAAERLVLDAADLAPIVLRLCPVYGRGDKGNVRTMIRAIHRRRFLVPGTGATRKSIVHVSSVVEVVRAAMQSAATGVFVVADREAPSIRELANVIAGELGRRRPPSLPMPLLTRAAALVDLGARLRGRTASTRSLIEKATTPSVCDPGRAIRELGVACHVDLAASVRDEIAWLRGAGLL